MKKEFWIILLFLLIFFIIVIVLSYLGFIPISGYVITSLENGSGTFNISNEIRLNISIYDVINLSGVQVNVSYNPDILSYNRTEENTFLNENGSVTTYFNNSEINTTSGNIRYIIIFREGEEDGATGNGTIASLYFNATHAGTSYVNISDALLSDNLGNPISSTPQNTSVTVAGDSASPAVTLNTPADNYNTSSQTIVFNATSYDGVNLKNVSIYGNWTGSWVSNVTNSSPINNTQSNFSVSAIPSGKYRWNVYACDNSSNCAFATSNRTFTVDSVAPAITINNPSAGATLSSTDVVINISFSDDYDFDYCSYNVTNSTGGTVVADNSITCATVSVEHQTISSGTNYVLTAFANDTSGNSNVTGRTFSIDTSGGGNGGGGGGGGGGTATTTNTSEIPSVEQTQSSMGVTPNSSALFNFGSETGIKKIEIWVKKEIETLEVTVSKYDYRPANVSVEMKGKVYKYLQIEPKNLGENLKNATATLQIEKSWLSENKIPIAAMSFFRFDKIKSKWEGLPTNYTSSDDTYSYYTSEIKNFSYFAIGERVTLSGLSSLFSRSNVIILLVVFIIIISILIGIILWKRHRDYHRM